MKKIIKTVIYVIIGLIVTVLLSLQMSFSFNASKTKTSYENIMKDSILNENAHLTDIAMLGAHDAFSNGITRTSGANVNEGGICCNKLVGVLGGGLIVRLSKAQNASAEEMLYAGVRYFDVRITKIEDEYYSFHGYLSYTLDGYLQDIVDFLATHPDEFIIFDIQHFYTSENDNFGLSTNDYQELLNYFDTIKNKDNKSLLDYIYYDAQSKDISDLTYKDVKGGVLMLAKCEGFSEFYVRDGDASFDNERTYNSIYSYWINSNDDNTMLEQMNNVKTYINSRSDLSNKFRINQAQKTGFFSDKRIISSLFQWSLIDMAASFNAKLVKDETTFKDNLKTMPILMVDNVTSSKGNFNSTANEWIIEYNKGL